LQPPVNHASHLFPQISFAEFDPEADLFGSGPTLEASDDELLPPSKSKYALPIIKYYFHSFKRPPADYSHLFLISFTGAKRDQDFVVIFKV
jgi:hypothetical protein